MLSQARKMLMTHPTDINSEPPSLPRAVDLDQPQHRTKPPRRVEYAHGDDERDLANAIQEVENELALYIPKPAPVLEPMPDYVEPREGVPPVGALSAEALVKDYEKTAKGIEAMAVELQEASQRAAKELADLNAHYATVAAEVQSVVEHVKQTATVYRDEAKGVFVRIEDITIRMKEVRELSEAMRERLAPAVTDSRLPPISFDQLSGDRDLSQHTSGDRNDTGDRSE